MKTTEEVQQTGLPSLLQIRYLMELERTGWKRGTVMEIAEKCGVSHPAVSRYLKSCCEKGILNEKYEFTTVGKMMLDRYRKLIDEIPTLIDKSEDSVRVYKICGTGEVNLFGLNQKIENEEVIII